MGAVCERARSYRMGCRAGELGMNDVFQLVEQLLGAADAEGRDQHGALVAQGVLDDGFEALAAAGAVFVQAVAVGAFEHQDVCPFGRLGRHEQWRMWRAKVTGENDAFVLAGRWICKVNFYVSGPKYMTSAL